MNITRVSIIHHVGIVLVLLWILTSLGYCHPILYFVSLIYLYEVNEGFIMRLRRKLKYEERKQANQKRLLRDSETVRWLNDAVEKMWPICMEQIVSQRILLPIMPWFLEKYKPWTAKDAVVESMYLGRSPPMFTDMRVVGESSGDDHLVLELGMNFLAADDMSATIAVKLRKRLGFGMWAKLHMTGMHVEGKVLVGVKFLQKWPYLGRLRVCFTEPPYFQMTVKPLFNHGLDVTEIPGIAGWVDELLAVAFEQTLVQPNLLVVDVEKFVSSPTETWFSVDEKTPIAFAEVEIIEGAEMKPSDLNGLADPYVKGEFGSYKFQTKVQKKTLNPKWLEEFKIPIYSWESLNVLALEVRDKDHFGSDTLGTCSIHINDLRSVQERHDMWLPLENIKMGRLHLAVTVIVFEGKSGNSGNVESESSKHKNDSISSETHQKGSDPVSSRNVSKMADHFEPINVEGQQQTGIWVHHPGSDVSRIWEPRKGKNRHADIQIANEDSASTNSHVSYNSNDSSSDENPEGHKSKLLGGIRRSMKKIGSVFHRSPKKASSSIAEEVVYPHGNGSDSSSRMDDNSSEVTERSESEIGSSHLGQSEVMSPTQSNRKGITKSIIKGAEKSVNSLKHVISKKGLDKGKTDSTSTEVESNISDEVALPPAIDFTPVDAPIEKNIIVAQNDSGMDMEEQPATDVAPNDVGMVMEEPPAKEPYLK